MVIQIYGYTLVDTFYLKCIEGWFYDINKVKIFQLKIWAVDLQTVQIEETLCKLGKSIGLIQTDVSG